MLIWDRRRISSSAAKPARSGAVDRAPVAAHSRPSDLHDAISSSKSNDSNVVRVDAVKAEHDFGYVEPNSKHRVTFAVANPNDSPLKIRKVRSECNYCIKIVGYPQEIAPRGVGRFSIDFVAPKKPTSYSSRIVLATDDPKRSLIALRIKADVGRALVVTPGVLNLGSLAVGERGEGTVTLINRGKKPFRPIYSTSSSPGCIARIPRASVPPGGKLSIPIVATAERSLGRKKCSVHIQTDNPNQPRLTVRMEYDVVPKGSTDQPKDNPKGDES